jgi:hypothetical protein
VEPECHARLFGILFAFHLRRDRSKPPIKNAPREIQLKDKAMNAKKLIAAAVLGTLVTVTATTQVATAAVCRRPVVYHHPVYGAYWNAPYYYPGYTVTVPAPTVYNYATVPAPAPYYTGGVYVAPRFGFRIR